MSQNVVLNGVTYSIPDVGDDGWGQNVTDYLVALSVAAGTAPVFINIVSVTTTPVTALNGRTYLVNTSSAKTIQLPTPTSNFYFIVRDVTGSAASNNITIARAGSENIDGAASNKTLSRPFGSWLIASNGVDWFTLNQFPDTGILNADVASAAGIAYSKLATLTVSRALVSSGAGVIEASGITSTELGYLSGVTSAVQTQINAKSPSASPTFSGTITTPLTASRAVVTGSSSELAVSAATATEVGYLSGVTSAIQTQINTKAPSASPTFSGTITTPLTASRALVTGASSELAVSATTATELGYVNGVTSAIQTQINARLQLAGGTMTGVITMTLAGGSDFLDLQGSGAGTVGIRIAPSGASSNSAKIIGTLNGSNTDLSFLVGGSARLNLDFNGRINGSAGIHRALSTTPDSTSGTTAYIESGTFTPAGTTGTNVTAITPGLATWNRVGRVVTISGQVSITTTAAVSSTCDISFPINSNIADANECSGTFSSLAAGSGRVIGNATNDRATFEWTATATGSNSYRYIYTYVIN